jgi:hypothetical protein
MSRFVAAGDGIENDASFHAFGSVQSPKSRVESRVRFVSQS